MNKFPLVEMLAFFSRYSRLEKPAWRKPYVKHMDKVRSCHSKVDGGIKKSFFSIETKSGELFDLCFNEEELLWSLESAPGLEDKTIDRVLAFIQRHKHTPSRAHRIIPFRFEILPKSLVQKENDGTELPLIHRMQPYRFQSGKINSAQVVEIPTRHMENTMITKHLNYVVKTDLHRFFHLVYILDELDWRFMQEVDEELFFAR
ncbi:MAG: hypothetical protein HUJ22_02270 [Gracilimonas sp.]|uniref:hypothetical protein n=1 Tax=Gracilimonas sp. TaxID=1974203 RepID=UPI001985F81F|nr:hypothetical protein [Gracilimonas sp.]MBD3615370.1 hypothetical protein [Gracilimonas sp.]